MRAAALACLLLLVACGGEAREHAAGPAPTTTTAPEVRTETVLASDGVVELGIALPELVPAGERVWAELVVRNVGARTVWWQAGGGSPPGSALLTGLPAVEAPSQTWSGEPGELASSLTRKFPDLPFVDEEHVGLSAIGRTLESRMEPLRPGERHARRVAVDVRLPAGGPSELTARVAGTFYDDPLHYGGPGSVGPRPAVVAERPVRVGSVPGDQEEALAAFAGDPRLAAFVDATRAEGVDGGWYAELVWWRGAWELTVTPEYGTSTRYRMRWRDGAVVDARRIWADQAPADDPEGRRYPTAPPDDVDAPPHG